jgi:hypothetical protein
MDLRKEILKEHSKRQTTKLVDYVGNNPTRFKALVNVFFAGPYRVTQRAAWPISICVEKHPRLVGPHLKKMLDYLKKPDIPDSVKRNTVRLLQHIEIPKRLHGRVADVCFGYLQNRKERVAVRVFSMSVLGEVAHHNPALKNELRLIIEDEQPYASAGFISRARKVLKKLKAES